MDHPLTAALLAPLAGAALLRAGPAWSWITPDGRSRPAAAWEVRHLLAGQADALLRVDVTDAAAVAVELRAAIHDQRALALWQILLDEDVDDDLRRRAAAHLRARLAEPSTREAMRRRVLSRRPPEGLDWARARALSAGAQPVIDLVDLVTEHHDVLVAVADATDARLSAADLAERADLLPVLTADAVVADLVLAVAAADRAVAGRTVLALAARHPALRRLPRALQDVVSDARARLGRKPPPLDPAVMVDARHAATDPAPTRRYHVGRAVEAIHTALDAGQHTRAAAYADELVARQLAAEGDATFANKTLCSLAARAERLAPDLAEAWLRRAVDLATTDPYPASQLLTLLRRQRRIDEALALAERALRDHPTHVPLRCTFAELLRQVGRLDDAAAEFREAQRLDPNDVVAWNGFAELCRQRGRLDDAESAYRHAQQLDPRDVFAWNGFAEVCRQRGRLDDAERAYRHAQQLDTNNVVAWTGFAELCRQRGRLDDAELAYRHAQQLDPRDVVAWNGFAELCRQRGRLDDAESAYRHAQQLDPRDVFAWNGFAELCRQRGRLDDAERAYRHAQRLDPRNVVAWTGFAELCRQRGRLDDAKLAYRHAQHLDPRDVVAWNGFAELCRQRGRLDDAERAYRHAQKLDPNNVVAWTGFAELCRQRGRLDDAERTYRHAQHLDPNNVVARSGLGGLQLQLRAWTAAEASFRAALTVDPRDSFARTGLAVARARQQRWDQALAALAGDALPETEADWWVLQWRGLLQVWRGDVDTALATLRRGAQAPFPDVRARFAQAVAAVELRRGRAEPAEAALAAAPTTDADDAELTTLLRSQIRVVRRDRHVEAELAAFDPRDARLRPLRDAMRALARAPGTAHTEAVWSATVDAIATRPPAAVRAGPPRFA